MEPQHKPVNHWQYSMTSLATPFPSSLTSPSFPPFFSPLPLTPSLSLAFSHSLLLSILHLCPCHLQFLCPLSPLLHLPLSLTPLSQAVSNFSTMVWATNIFHLHIYQRWFENQSVYNIATACLRSWLLPTNVIELPSHLVWYVSNHCLGIVYIKRSFGFPLQILV